MKRVTLRDVANASGYSAATVSRVVGGSRPVKRETARRVLAVSSELGYRTDQVARALRSGSTATVGMVVPQITNPYFPSLVHQVERILNASGRALLLSDSNDDPTVEAARVSMLLDRQIDGLIIIPCDEQESRRAVVAAAAEVPVVQIDRRVEGGLIDAVTVDNDAGMRALLDHLASIGRTKLAFVGAEASVSSARERLDAYTKIATASSRGNAERVYLGQFSIAWGREATEWLLRLDDLPDAIVCANDMIAIGVVQALANRGIPIPDQIAVTGFDDAGFAEVCSPALTTCRQPIRGLSMEAVRLMDSQFRDIDGKPAAHVRLTPKLVIRRSTTGKGAFAGAGESLS